MYCYSTHQQNVNIPCRWRHAFLFNRPYSCVTATSNIWNIMVKDRVLTYRLSLESQILYIILSILATPYVSIPMWNMETRGPQSRLGENATDRLVVRRWWVATFRLAIIFYLKETVWSLHPHRHRIAQAFFLVKTTKWSFVHCLCSRMINYPWLKQVFNARLDHLSGCIVHLVVAGRARLQTQHHRRHVIRATHKKYRVQAKCFHSFWDVNISWTSLKMQICSAIVSRGRFGCLIHQRTWTPKGSGVPD